MKIEQYKFTNQNCEFKINHRKIFFNKIKVIEGDIKDISLEIIWKKPSDSFGRGIATHKNQFSPSNYIDLYAKVVDGNYLLKNDFPNGWFDFSEKEGEIIIKGLNRKNQDFDFIIYFNVKD